MILSDEDVEARLNSPDNLLNKVKIVQIPKGGKTAGAADIPPLVRGLLGSIAVSSNESGSSIGSVFGVSAPVVNNAARGLVDDRHDEDLADTVEIAKQTIKQKTEDAHSLALDSLMQSLITVGPKISEAAPLLSIKELTRTAKDLSTVVTNIQRNKVNEKSDEENRTIVILHTTERRKEAVYDVIDV